MRDVRLVGLAAAVLLLAGLAVYWNRAMTPHDKHFAGGMLGLPVQFDYPAVWLLQEERGTVEPYRQVRVRGQRNADDTYTCFMAVRISPVKSQGGRYHDTLERVRALRELSISGQTTVSDHPLRVAGLPATEVRATLEIPAQHKPELKAIAIPVKTTTIVLQHGTNLYELQYSCDAREYDRYANAFRRLVRSFRLLT